MINDDSAPTSVSEGRTITSNTSLVEALEIRTEAIVLHSSFYHKTLKSGKHTRAAADDLMVNAVSKYKECLEVLDQLQAQVSTNLGLGGRVSNERLFTQALLALVSFENNRKDEARQELVSILNRIHWVRNSELRAKVLIILMRVSNPITRMRYYKQALKLTTHQDAARLRPQVKAARRGNRYYRAKFGWL